ncbi:MAG: PcfB family protein [Eubacteriales bacterium]|nr:PcfB family protein [Eubacteriales bacterium]
MQEEIENKTVNLTVSTTKLSARTIIRGFQLWKAHHDKVKAKKAAVKDLSTHGKQSIKELIGQNQGVTNIDISKTDLRGFEQVARKYGVDYAITKDKGAVPPKYMVFFKAKDADALTAAFTEFSNQKLKKLEKPSVLKQLAKLKEMVAAIMPDKVRHKSQERDL